MKMIAIKLPTGFLGSNLVEEMDGDDRVSVDIAEETIRKLHELMPTTTVPLYKVREATYNALPHCQSAKQRVDFVADCCAVWPHLVAI